MNTCAKALSPGQLAHNLYQLHEEKVARERRIALRRKPSRKFAKIWVTLLVWPSAIAFGFIFTGLGWTEFAQFLTALAN